MAEKLNFLDQIDEPDYTIDPENIDFNDEEQAALFEQQFAKNRRIYLQKELRKLFNLGIIDRNGNFIKDRNN